MKKNSWKFVGSMVAVLGSGTLFAGCATEEVVAVEGTAGGAEIVAVACDSSCTPEAAAAKSAMQGGKTCPMTGKTMKSPDAKACPKADAKACPQADAKACPMKAKAVADPNSFEGQAGQLAATLAGAFQKGDAKAFVAALPEDMRKDFDESKFKAAHKQMVDAMGEAVSGEYVTDLAHPLLAIQIWKIGFQKENSQGQMMTQQALFQVSIGKVDGKAQVVSFGFI